MGAIAGIGEVRIPIVDRSGRLRGYTAEVAPVRTGRLRRRPPDMLQIPDIYNPRGPSGVGNV